MSGHPATPLLLLADAAGLQTVWRDALGVPHRVGEDTLRAVLEALGLACGGPAQCRESLAALDVQSSQHQEGKLLLVRQGQPLKLKHRSSLHYCLRLEQGGILSGTAAALPDGQALLPAVHAPGYHRLEMGGGSYSLAVVPRRAPQTQAVLRKWHEAAGKSGQAADVRAWVLGAQVYSLWRGEESATTDFGGQAPWPGWETGGDFSLLGRLADAAARQGAAGLAISPVHAMFAADPCRDSPYAPSSRLFYNVMYADPAVVFEADFLQHLGPPVARPRVDDTGCLDWPAIYGARMAQLQQLFAHFERLQPHGPHSDFAAFMQKGGEALQAHACYEALHAYFLPTLGAGHGWMDWPAAYRHPQSAVVQRFAEEQRPSLRFHIFLQWLAARSLAAAQARAAACMPLGLIADLAVGTDPRGSHAWSRQSQIMAGVAIGAPPDIFQTQGQNWGLTAFSPWALRRHGYAGYIETLRAVLAHAGGLRVDHIMGLARLWLVPAGGSAAEGVYLSYPFQAMADLLVLEAWRHRAVVVGESLGTVPEGFIEALEQRGILGMNVLWFEHEDGHPPRFHRPQQWPVASMAMATTHDLPTVCGWWAGRDISWRERRGDYDGVEAKQQRQQRIAEKQALWAALQAAGLADSTRPLPETAPLGAILSYVAATPAVLHQLALEDLSGQYEQPNLPGGPSQGGVEPHPNWRRTLPAPVDTLLTQGSAPVLLRAIRCARQGGGLQGAAQP